MSKNEIKTEAEQDFSILVPVEGYPGLFTYKDAYIPDKEEMDRILAEAGIEMLIGELPEEIEEMDLTDMELVPFEGYPGLFTYRPLSSE